MVDRGENLFKAIVVDDDPTICEFVTAIAVNHGLAVTSAMDPRDFKAAYTEDLDLIFLDLYMPSIDGIELLRFLADSQSQAMIVIMSAMEEDIVACRRKYLDRPRVTHSGGLKEAPVAEKIDLDDRPFQIHGGDRFIQSRCRAGDVAGGGRTNCRR